MPNSIHLLLSQKIVELLKPNLQDNVPGSDPARVDVLKVGLFQQNPKHDNANVYVTVVPGIRGRDDVYDGLVTLNDFEDIAINVPAREMGGGTSWWRILGIEFGVYYIKGPLTEEQALNAAGVVQQRIINTLDGKTVNVCDDFGECACQLFVAKASMFESGGVKPKTFIWRGKVLVMVLTERQTGVMA